MNEQPPDGIGTDSVHPVGHGSGIANQVQTLGDDFIVSEHGVYRHEFGMQVANPYQAVALHTVPNIFLHIEVYGIGSRHPNVVQALVVRLERTEVRDVAIAEGGTHLLQHQHRIRLFQIDAHETESRIADFGHTQPRQHQLEIADGMVVGRSVLGSDVAHGFRSRFAETHTDPGLLLRREPRHELDTSLEFLTEVEQERSLALRTVSDSALLPRHQFGLSDTGREELFKSFDRSIARGFLPHDSGRRKIGNGTATHLDLFLMDILPYGWQSGLGLHH